MLRQFLDFFCIPFDFLTTGSYVASNSGQFRFAVSVFKRILKEEKKGGKKTAHCAIYFESVVRNGTIFVAASAQCTPKQAAAATDDAPPPPLPVTAMHIVLESI